MASHLPDAAKEQRVQTMFTFDQPKPRQRRSPAQQNEWYPAGSAESFNKLPRAEQGWYASSHDLAHGLEVVEADEEIVRQMFAETEMIELG